ncbi:MAG TPA: cytochrome C oxidase subunit IV family protein [Acidimicrobiales bacterium]|nr:cytochrome C oxidase subunit IV family protein [Acidimicrobiales bacterium]
MSTTVEHPEHHEHADMNIEHAHHDHPSDWTYIKVALVLGVMTAIEVALSYVEVGEERITVGLLLAFAVAKFATVVAYFMHLKFDHPWFRRLFVTGIVLAVFCYVVYLSTLHVFAD